MNGHATSTRPELLDDLPAFFQEDVDSDPLHPIKALLQVFQDNIKSIGRQIEHSDLLFDPETLSDSVPDPKEIQFLQWLASWVALELDQDWLNPAGGQPGNYRAVALIKDAARLYRERGTPHGFKAILERFYAREVEVLERSWPQGAQLECCSSIGVDFWLTGQPTLQNCFVLVIHPTATDREAVGVNIGTVESNLLGTPEPRKVLWLLSGKAVDDLEASVAPDTASNAVEESAAAGISDPWTRTVDRIRHTVVKEKPAHTRCYLAVPTVSEEMTESGPAPLVLGIDSAIEQFSIQ